MTKRQGPKREFNIVTSGQFRTLAMFAFTCITAFSFFPISTTPIKFTQLRNWDLSFPVSRPKGDPPWGQARENSQSLRRVHHKHYISKATFSDFHSSTSCNWCYKSHSISLKCNWCQISNIKCWMLNVKWQMANVNKGSHPMRKTVKKADNVRFGRPPPKRVKSGHLLSEKSA